MKLKAHSYETLMRKVGKNIFENKRNFQLPEKKNFTSNVIIFVRSPFPYTNITKCNWQTNYEFVIPLLKIH